MDAMIQARMFGQTSLCFKTVPMSFIGFSLVIGVRYFSLEVANRPQKEIKERPPRISMKGM